MHSTNANLWNNWQTGDIRAFKNVSWPIKAAIKLNVNVALISTADLPHPAQLQFHLGLSPPRLTSSSPTCLACRAAQSSSMYVSVPESDSHLILASTCPCWAAGDPFRRLFAPKVYYSQPISAAKLFSLKFGKSSKLLYCGNLICFNFKF